ncbi:DUF72 domain-containing protein [Candidatus Bathyarchaeota archaeon]|nr:DUF72 domain-containing protein [Candidatus Bathyarchaeota archaeon]
MVEILIGAGGWSYFNVPGDRLRAYASAFKTVEVNSTYYRIPPVSVVERWRKRVPDDFEFTVRCNQGLISRLQNEPVSSSLRLYDEMKEICSVLDAKIMHIQIPSDFILNNPNLSKIEKFLSLIDTSRPGMAWEIRSPKNEDKDNILRILQRHNIVHCIDLSRETPSASDNIIYSRLFGKGEHNIYQFTNTELKEIDGKVRTSSASKAYLNFHGTRMYKDAARISIYEATSIFPKVTKGIGISSVIEVLKEDAQFPSTTSELAKSQGWKVCEWNIGQQLHLSEILSKIEEKRFASINDLEFELKHSIHSS